MEKETSTKAYFPLPTPDLPSGVKPPPALTGDEEAKRLEVFNHFTKEDYQLPGIEENAGLMEIEKFWLVSFRI